MSFTLQQALAAHQKGDIKQAEKLYKQQLQRNSNDINALQLLGTLYASQGDLESAVHMLQKSLSINHELMPVHANLAICYKRLGWFAKAQRQYRKMIELDVNHSEAYNSLIRLMIEQEDFGNAQIWLELALSQFEDDLMFLQLDAELCRHKEQYPLALSKYKTLLTRFPDRQELIHNYALTLRLNGEPREALEHYIQLRKSGVEGYQLFHNIANAYSDLGNLEEAINYYRRAISLRPGYVPSHTNLNELLWEVGNKDDFLHSFHNAFPLETNNNELKYSYCQFLLRLTKYQECIDFLTSTPQPTIKSAKYCALLAKSYLRLGKQENGIRYYRMAEKLADFDSDGKVEFAQALIETGCVAEAEKILQDVVQNNSDNQLALALQAVCWRILDDPREKLLNDYENLVKEYEIELPSGYASLQEFCDELNDYLVNQHVGTNQPLEQTLTGGTQTRGNLFDDQALIIQQLLGCLKNAIGKYTSTTVIKNPDCSNYKIDKSAQITFTGSWSVRLKNGGHHTSHIHPMGTLSSAFYVALPKEVQQTKTNDGYFTVGKPNVKTLAVLDAQKVIRPVVGKLVLFPSYMWHSTLPFESEEFRTTVAFDVKFMHPES